jgi:hypothetical protein
MPERAVIDRAELPDPPVVEPWHDRRTVMFPLWFFQAYMAFTVFLFAVGPWPWPVPDPVLLYAFLFLAQWSLWFGYKSAAGSRPGGYRGPWTAVGLIKASLVLNLACIIPNYALRMGRHPAGLSDIVNSISTGLINPAVSYAARNQALAGPVKRGLIEYTPLAMYPILWLLVPLAVVYWSRLKRRHRILIVAFIGVDLMSWVAIGTNKGIADFVIVLPWLLIAANPGVIRSVFQPRNLKILGVFLIGFVLLLTYFAVGQKGRRAGSVPTSDASLSISLDDGNWMVRSLPPGARGFLAAATSYLGQGYCALSLALKEPFVWSYGAGNSFFLTTLIEDFTGKGAISDRTYPARIEKFGMNRYGNWHSFYTWIASDTTFPGTLIVMFLIGRLFALTWLDVLRKDNPFAPALFALLIVLLFYIPANNQVLGYVGMANGFWVILIIWALTRKHYYLAPVSAESRRHE